MGASRTGRATIPVLVVGLMVAACSGGPSAEVTAFCDDYVGVDALLGSGPDETDPMPWIEEVTVGLEGLKADAPAEISSAVGSMADALLEPVANLDEEGFFAATESETFAEDSAVVDEYVGTECGFGSVEVTAVDYAFDADLESLEAGQVAFEFTNEGTELHEMALIRVNDDTTESIEELLELPEEEAQTKTTFLGVSIAAPGDGDVMYANLDPGRYVMICFIPTGSTSMEEAETAEGPPHFTNGMLRDFTIEG